MKIKMLSGIVLVAGLIALTACVVATAADARAGEAVVVKGQFEWSKRPGWHDITGTFTPAADGEWTVVWSFKWGRKPCTYKGVAKGDLMNGEVSGTGNDAQRKRTFSFKGTATDGVIEFTHAETTRGEPQATGTGKITVQ